METTLVLIKPDGVQKKLCGEIISRFERRGFKIVALKMLRLTREQAERHYGEHRGKTFFSDLVEFITSGPIVAMAIRGQNAIKAVRAMMGPTNPLEAPPGTIRGDYALSVSYNIVHGSDSADSAARELALFFNDDEMCNDL